MEKHLKGNLRGLELFKAWVIPTILTILVTVFLIINMMIQRKSGDMIAFIIFFILGIFFLIGFIVYCHLSLFKMSLDNLEYPNELKNSCTYKGLYIRSIGGLFLTILTFGVYYAWYVKSLSSYIVKNTSYEDHSLELHGDTIVLFGKIFLTFIILVVINKLTYPWLMTINLPGLDNRLLGIFLATVMFTVQNAITNFAQLSYLVLGIRFGLNISYKNYNVIINQSFIMMTMFIFLQFIISSITFGLYLPMAVLLTYRYMIQSLTLEDKLSLRFEGSLLKGYFRFLANMLLSILTLGIFTPWAAVNITNWLINHSVVIGSLEEEIV